MHSIQCMYAYLDDATFNHLMVQIITLTSALTNSSKHWITTMIHSNVINQFHNNDRFTDTSTTKKADFSAFSIRCE